VTKQTRRFFYPTQHYEHWATEFWAVYRALVEDSYQELDQPTLAVVAALLVATNSIDDLRDLGR
jgi:hypothetical protein